MPLSFSTSYLSLGDAFSQKILPTPVVKPELLLWNKPLATQLDITESDSNNAELLAQYFSGNETIEGSKPVAQAYSGHQFGQFNPNLGDGRAHLLGDITDSEGKLWDVQLKGSGVSHFSRQGDGRCALGPALREFIMSEAMHALGVPTTRCLAIVATGEAVYRERALPGAVVTRIASSHIRVGTFQYFSARRDVDSLSKLTSYAIKRHFPELHQPDTELTTQQVLDFFAAVLDKQVTLLTSWLRVGFIHGVMNTDNTAISGETIDYGPCAMMNHYHSDTVFSSIDRRGRYAFGKQAGIMQWNMARLAECLIPVIAKLMATENGQLSAELEGVDKEEIDEEKQNAIIALLEPLLINFSQNLNQDFYKMMGGKLGISQVNEDDHGLISDLLALMQRDGRDFTRTFVELNAQLTTERVESLAKESVEGDDWQVWCNRWVTRVADDMSSAKVLMARNNPIVIPRNHHVEAVLAHTQETGNLTSLNAFLSVLRQPYVNLAETKSYQDSPADGGVNYNTFCGT